MKTYNLLTQILSLLLVVMATPAFSQVVSNDNEDGVYKIDSRMARNDFVPGQVLVKFKDENTFSVRHNAKGKYLAASISAVDQLLRQFGVTEMQKLFPNEVAKPKSQLRRKKAPNGTIVQERNLDKVFWVKTNIERSDSTLQLIERLKALPEVEYAEPNYKVYITADGFEGNTNTVKRPAKDICLAPVRTETDATIICTNPNQNPLYSQQYGIIQQNIHQLWDKPIINKKRPVIAILDTGVDITHPDLKDNIWQNTQEVEGEMAYDDDGNGIVDDKYGWNFVEDYYDLTDYNGHGTHVAGIAAASDNSIGVIGANPLALIMPVKVMGDKGTADIATICRGIIYAAENGADIINMSFGHIGWITETEINAIQKAYQTTVLVASAGNNSASVYDPYFGPCWPAAYYLVLGVQASGSNGQLAGFSNYDPDGSIYSEDGIDGRNHEIVVPGVDIYSTYPNGNYKKLSGTSMSAPLFAGAVSALQMVKEFPSKDVLYGDLIHLEADFAKIYSDDTPRYPFIDLGAITIDDNVEGNTNIDGQVDVGETICFYPLLRNTWADATDIRLRLTVDPVYASFVDITNPEVDFGYSLSAYARSQAKTPFRVTFGDNIGDYTRIKFTMEITCAESNQFFKQDVYVTVNNMVKISGLISEDRTLTADHVYYVNENLAILEGATLTIEPGTRIEFAGDMGLSSNGKLVANGTPEKPIVFTHRKGEGPWAGIMSRLSFNNEPLDTISFCKIDGYKTDDLFYLPYMKDCYIIPSTENGAGDVFQGMSGVNNTITGIAFRTYYGINTSLTNSNIVNNDFGGEGDYLSTYSQLAHNNYFNNSGLYDRDYNKYYGKRYWLSFNTSTPEIDKSDNPSYLGTSREDIVRPHLYEIGNAPGTYGQIDLSNMLTEPIHESHGIVWKVVVNGKDAQDEFEDLAPLGVGRHKFEVYYNRPMNKAIVPQISFGVREPYTQHVVEDDGSWNDEGTIYTAYFTISGKTMSDGLNRIYVQGGEDNEYFECPYEKDRFNIMIQAAGSMATGFAAEAGRGSVNLSWNNEENDFDDAMGFNVYRYGEAYEMEIYNPHYDNEGNFVEYETVMVADTIRVNTEILDIETTSFTDYNVNPGETYYYYYKVLSTDLKEYDVSNVVAATPQTSKLGDANGSGDVDVADVITTVNYASGQQPKPFIFEAADMNADQSIDILDVIGIIKIIMHQGAGAETSVAAVATYTIEDGIVYVDSPVEVAGVQIQLATSPQQNILVAEDMRGFEHTSAWLSDNDYLFLGYNMNGKTLSAGKHAILIIGDSQIADIRLSDAYGHNIMTESSTIDKVDRMARDVMTVEGIYDLQGRKLSGKAIDLQNMPKGVYIVNGQKVVK